MLIETQNTIAEPQIGRVVKVKRAKREQKTKTNPQTDKNLTD